jgi:hypothetical protein
MGEHGLHGAAVTAETRERDWHFVAVLVRFGETDVDIHRDNGTGGVAAEADAATSQVLERVERGRGRDSEFRLAEEAIKREEQGGPEATMGGVTEVELGAPVPEKRECHGGAPLRGGQLAAMDAGQELRQTETAVPRDAAKVDDMELANGDNVAGDSVPLDPRRLRDREDHDLALGF